MLAVLPPLFLLLTLVAAASRVGLRQGFVIATLIYTMSVVVATELLSIPARFSYVEVAAFWAGAAALAALWLWRWGDAEAPWRGCAALGAFGLRGDRNQPPVVVKIGSGRSNRRWKVRGEGSSYRTHLVQPNGVQLLRRVDGDANRPKQI